MGVHAERMQNLCEKMFSHRYLNEVSRGSALGEFYKTRHVPPTLAQEGHDIDTAILHLLRGTLKNIDLRPYLEKMTMPVLFVYSSENTFVLPSNSDVFLEVVGGPKKASKS